MKGSVAVVVLLLSAPAWSLDKKEAGALKRAGNFIANLREQVEGTKGSQYRFTQRQADELKARLDRAANDLAKLPADDEGVKAELANLEQVRAMLAEQEGGLKAAEGAKADKIAAIAALFTSPDFATDEETLHQLENAFDDAGLVAPDSYLYARWTTHGDLAVMRTNVKAWPQLKEKFTALSTKYESCAERLMVGEVEVKRSTFCVALRELKDNEGQYAGAIETLRTKGSEQLEKDGAALQQAVDAAVKRNDVNVFLDPDGNITALRNRVLNLASVWEGVAPSEADGKKMLERARALDGAAEQSMQRLSEAIITTNKGPKQVYAGADAAELEKYVRARWAKDYPKEAVVAVRFVAGAFERRTSWDWDASRSGFVKRDESSLPGWVVVKDGGDRAIMWPISVYRMHLKGDSLAFETTVRGSVVSPTRRLLLKNL
ncbi:MAG: hypothetical protein U0228_06195 [Myxococcaceae bacterium]